MGNLRQGSGFRADVGRMDPVGPHLRPVPSSSAGVEAHLTTLRWSFGEGPWAVVESRLSAGAQPGGVGVVRAVVFDLDGVIISSEEVWDDVRRALVADRGGRWRPEGHDRMMGMST